VKDQATKASVDPFNVSGLEGPSRRFNERANASPIAVKQ
jgi:hypothetical protein